MKVEVSKLELKPGPDEGVQSLIVETDLGGVSIRAWNDDGNRTVEITFDGRQTREFHNAGELSYLHQGQNPGFKYTFRRRRG